MNLLKEFNLFKKEVQLPEQKDDVLDTIYFRCYGNTSLDTLDALFERLKDKKISFISHKNIEIITIIKSIKFEYSLDKQTVFFVFNDDLRMQPMWEKGVKILGKRIKTAEDPLGEEDWEE